MTLLSRPKDVVIRPKVCHRCRERMGAVPVHTLSSAAGAEGELWLCAGCAWTFGRPEPLCS